MAKRVVLPAHWAEPGTLAYEVMSFAVRQRRRVWLVGGAVRDRLLLRRIHDLDLVVKDGAADLAQAIADRFGGAFYLLDQERDYGRALLSEAAGKRSLIVDVTPLQGRDLEEDLRGRDFTINAMAVLLRVDASGDLIDPLGGLQDLRTGVLRLASEHALEADPIRLLRAPRLAGELELRITPETIQAIRDSAERLADASAERIRDELWRMLGHPGCARAVHVLHRLRLLAVVLPEAEALTGITQGPPHHWGVFEHTIQTMLMTDRILALILGRDRPRDVVETLMWERLSRYASPLRDHLLQTIRGRRRRAGWLRWLALTHDWGKGITRMVGPDGRIRFLGHDREGARLAYERLNALRFSREEARHLRRMVRHHMRPLFLTRKDRPPTARAIYRFFRDVDDAGLELLLLGLADHRATYGPDLHLEDWRDHVARIVDLMADWFERRDERVAPPPLVDGHTLIQELGVPPGPEIGRLLEAVREAQAVGEVRDREEALAFVRRLHEQNVQKQKRVDNGADSGGGGGGG
ncbi:MAG: HD domain-containing protein [Chloroflexi bacterium]|nr:HD domain-containing protein [Chloroflexota bacterium]